MLLDWRQTDPHILISYNGPWTIFQKTRDSSLVGYTDAGYMSDPHKARSQQGFIFLHGGMTISWKSSKQILLATSKNHYKIIALYEASHECVWLRRMINHISNHVELVPWINLPLSMKIMQTCYIKSNMTKHITPKLLFPAWASAKWRDKYLTDKILRQPRWSFHQISTSVLIWKMCSRDWYEMAWRVAGFRALEN